VVFEKSWSSQTSAACCDQWFPVSGSTITATTNGGPLLIQMNVYMAGGSHATCRPTIDGVWAEDFASLPISPTDPYWTEGILGVGITGDAWHAWNKSRIYFNVPAGSHMFRIQCATDEGTLTIGSSPTVTSSWSIIELR